MSPHRGLGPLERIDRSRARAWVLQVHYRWESGGEAGSLRDALADTMATRRISPRRLPYVRQVITEMGDHLEAVDDALDDALDNWRMERLSTIDRAVLPNLMEYWVPEVEVTGVHEMVGNALILEGEKKRTTDLRGETLPGMEEEEEEDV